MLIYSLLLLIFKSTSSIDYSKFSWTLESNFNYQHPDKSILNLAYPSSIAYYYVTIIPPRTNYSFFGKFLTENVYESSLTIYNSNGLIDDNYKSINTYNTDKYISYQVNNDKEEIKYLLQRYYVNLYYYNENDLIKNLFKVYDITNKNFLPSITEYKRLFLSKMIYQPLQTLISWISPDSLGRFSKFYLPGEFTGLFPDMNHYYLISFPGKFKLFKIQGKFKPQKRFPYIDFITINQKSASTDNGLPFYEFLNEDFTYEIYISSPDIDDSIIKKFDSNARIIKWLPNNINRGIIFRIIDYTNYGIANGTGPLSPEETEDLMLDFYPKIDVIDIKI
tara:strand:+ start:1132 stop:2136 length:1005 start_codon:yes stop_codon:yes gene_type:complete